MLAASPSDAGWPRTSFVALLVALGAGAAASTACITLGVPADVPRLTGLATLLPIGAYGIAAVRAGPRAVGSGVRLGLMACAVVGAAALVGLAATAVADVAGGAACATIAVVAAVVAIVTGNVGAPGTLFRWSREPGRALEP